MSAKPSPLLCPTTQVDPKWIDYNGHMNMAYYHLVFDQGVDFAYDKIGIGADYLAQGGSCFTREVHVHYLSELALGEPIQVTWQLLDWDAKRLHFFEQMYRGSPNPTNPEENLVATSEQMALHVDMGTRRTAPFPEFIQSKLEAMMADHQQLERPPQVGTLMQIRRSS